MKAIQKITAVFLALVFLFSSFGFTISSMVCLKSGKGKVSLASIENCCAKKQALAVKTKGCDDNSSARPGLKNVTVIKKGGCCDISNYTIKLTDFQKAEQSLSQQPVILNTLLDNAQALHVSQTSHAPAYGYTDLPPPLYGRTLLNFISILLI